MIHLPIGIDVSKDTLDICAALDDGTFRTFKATNDSKGFAKISAWLKSISDAEWRICLEATSAYHRQIVLWFAERGTSILVMNPKRARDLAKGLGVLRKSDPADARVLSACAKMAWREPTPLPSGKKAELQEISRRIEVLVRNRADERRRLKKPGACDALLSSCRRLIDMLGDEIKALENQWLELLSECSDLQVTYDVILTVPSIGAKQLGPSFLSFTSSSGQEPRNNVPLMRALPPTSKPAA